jgi:hypothetical protein
MFFSVRDSKGNIIGHVKAPSLYYASELAVKLYDNYASIVEEKNWMPPKDELDKGYLLEHVNSYFERKNLKSIDWNKLSKNDLYRIFAWIDEVDVNAGR